MQEVIEAGFLSLNLPLLAAASMGQADHDSRLIPITVPNRSDHDTGNPQFCPTRHREAGLYASPRMARTQSRSVTSGGLPPFRSTQLVKSRILTMCSTGIFVTRTGAKPSGMAVTHSASRTAARPRATASYRVEAVTSTEWLMHPTRSLRRGTSELPWRQQFSSDS